MYFGCIVEIMALECRYKAASADSNIQKLLSSIRSHCSDLQGPYACGKSIAAHSY